MFITVVGGGNSTIIFACLAKRAGHQVAILTRRPREWNHEVSFNNEDAGYLDGVTRMEATIDIITSSPSECVPQADMIFLAGLPIHHNFEVLSKTISPHLDRQRRVLIGSICGYGGFHWVAGNALGSGKYVLFATQLIPWCCGTIEYGRVGVVYGAKRFVRVALETQADDCGVRPQVGDILRIKDIRPTDFIASTFWPNNPVIHPPILYGLFKHWDGHTPFNPDEVPHLIYAELSDDSANYMEILDSEIVRIVDKLKTHYPQNSYLQGNFQLQHCILENYGDQVKDPRTLASTVKTNAAYAFHKIPYEQLSNGKLLPILKHKFFETDLPYGLCVFKDIAVMMGIATPLLDDIILWNQSLINKEYLVNGKISGKDASQCVLPSAMGLDLETLTEGFRR
eukprot:gb/GECG01014673.1/.p1 GENE.gb/GECG01014673.1/~~gb/GECG01014673.1/.p1  ORF type:complete len:397 (+),score=38.80 gb/GECG01014673.1/:1-1191(+)